MRDVSNSQIRKTVQNTSLQTDNCEQFFVTVTPSNAAGLGPPSSITASRISQGLLNNLVFLAEILIQIIIVVYILFSTNSEVI